MTIDTEDAGLIDAIAAQQLGAPQQAAPAATDPAAAVAAAQQQPQAQPKPEDQPTAQEQATQQMAPTTQSGKEPFDFFEVDMGDGNKRQYTPEQIRGIVNRYSGLNYKHQTEVAPIQQSVGILNKLREQASISGQELSDDQMAQLLETALTAYSKNPTIGNNTVQPPADQTRKDVPVESQVSSAASNQDIESMMAEWEQQNAVSLPPFYKDAIREHQAMGGKLQNLEALVQQMAQAGAQATQTASQQMAQVGKDRNEVLKQRLVNNLDRVQQELSLPNEAANDFLAFVQGRGYDLPELLDYSLAKTLANDFKNNMQAPELERFRQIHEKRQAFTGNTAPSAGAGGAPQQAAADPDAAFIDEMSGNIMKQRNMM